MTRLAKAGWLVDLSIKGAALGAQAAGFVATYFGMTPLNIYLFAGGLLGWLIASALWRDKVALMIHTLALGAIVMGMASV